MSIIPQPEFPKSDLNEFNAITLPEFIDIPAINGMAREEAPYQRPLFSIAVRALELAKPKQPYVLGDFRAYAEGIETFNTITLAVTNGSVDLRPIELAKWSDYIASEYSDPYRIADRIRPWSEEFENTWKAIMRIGERYPLAIQSLSVRAIGAQMAEEIQRGDYEARL